MDSEIIDDIVDGIFSFIDEVAPGMMQLFQDVFWTSEARLFLLGFKLIFLVYIMFKLAYIIVVEKDKYYKVNVYFKVLSSILMIILLSVQFYKSMMIYMYSPSNTITSTPTPTQTPIEKVGN